MSERDGPGARDATRDITSERIIGADALDGGLEQLEPLATAIFGRRARAPGWFARKLAREGVRPELSTIARDGSRLLGYALLGHAPSRGPIARGAGVGLIEAARGRGLGGELVELALARARDHGYEQVEFLAEDARLPWYRRLGFVPGAVELTLSSQGRSRDIDLARVALPPTTPLGPSPLWSWFPEAWTRSPAGSRLVVELDAGRVWLLREGRAWLAVRAELRTPACLDTGPAALFDELRARLDRATALLAFPCPAAAPWVHAAIHAGIQPIQRATVVRRPTC